MKTFFCAFFVLILFCKSYSQCDSAFFRYTATSIADISLITGQIVVATGDHGYIIKSTNGGKSWRNIPVNAKDDIFNNIQFTSRDTGYVAGSPGIYKTEDQGENWFPLLVAKNAYNDGIVDFSFTTVNKGFFIQRNGHLLETFDGGRTFKDTVIDSDDYINCIDFLDDSTGIIGGKKGVFKTVDGGKSWLRTDISLLSFYSSLTKIKFVTKSVLYAFGAQREFLKSADGGSTWVQVQNSVQDVSDFLFFDENNGMIAGSYGVATTNDGGQTFHYNTNYPTNATSFTKLNRDSISGIIMASSGASFGSAVNSRNIIVTKNKGTSWEEVSSSATYKYSSMQVFNDSTVILGGNSGTMLKTYDYGESWRELARVPSANANDVIDFNFADSLNGFAITEDIYKTFDGGKSWKKKNLPGNIFGTYNLHHLFFTDSVYGFASGSNLLFRTGDGATTWQPINDKDYNNFITGIYFFNASRGFTIATEGSMMATVDSGNTWKKVDLNTTLNLNTIYFYDGLTGFIGTSGSDIYKTTDGGNTWKKINTGLGPLNVISFAFLNNLNGYMVSSDRNSTGNIYYTKDGGDTWKFLRYESTELTKMAGKKEIYYTGASGIIAKLDRQVAPSIPGYIYGTTKICVNELSLYMVPGNDKETFTWTLQGDGNQTGKYRYDTVLWNSGGTHTLSVAAKNVCGTGPYRSIAVNVLDFKPFITVTDSSLNVTKGISYSWYRNDTLIAQGETDSLAVFFAERAGTYKAEVKSDYGCSRFTDTVYYKPGPVHNTKAGNWSDPSIWSNHHVPNDSTDVVLLYDITIDQNTTCKSLKTNNHTVHLNANIELIISGH